MTVAVAESPLRVLVVDDDLDTIEYTALTFRMKGHDARTACSGTEAIERTKAFCPHLILLNLAMPQMDGFHVLRALRDIPCVADSGVVAVTEYAYPVDRRRCAEAGFDLHLTKPLDFSVLEELFWLCQESARLRAQSRQLALRQTHALVTFVDATIQMANAFLDVSVTTTNRDTKQRCLEKAEKMHRKMAELVQSKAPERSELIAWLDELKWRCQRSFL
jgi:CheY-like chemotaxis protein